MLVEYILHYRCRSFRLAANILFPKQTFDYHVINDSIGEINPLGGVTQNEYGKI